MLNRPRLRQWLIASGALVGWFAVILQFYLILLNRKTTVPETILRFFSFFTILSNILTATCFSFLFLAPKSKGGRFFSRVSTLTAITVYLFMVGAVYNTVLRFLWAPTGSQHLVDELLHVVMPLLILLFWIFLVPRAVMPWKLVFIWLIYPVAYLLFVLFRGSFSGFYPYPFVEVNNLGYAKVFLNGLLLILFFLLLSLLFVWMNRWKKNSSPRI